MGIIELDGKNVYTDPDYGANEKDLRRNKICKGFILKSFFAEEVFISGRGLGFVRKRFDEVGVQNRESGLLLKLGIHSLTGERFFFMLGAEEISSFLSETGISGEEVYNLKGRKIKGHYQGDFLLGISPV